MAVVFSSPTIQREVGDCLLDPAIVNISLYSSMQVAPFISDPVMVTKMIPLGNLNEVQGKFFGEADFCLQ